MDWSILENPAEAVANDTKETPTNHHVSTIQFFYSYYYKQEKKGISKLGRRVNKCMFMELIMKLYNVI